MPTISARDHSRLTSPRSKRQIIYCDLSRYVERKEEEDGKVVVKMYDPDIDEVETKANLVAGGCGTAVSGTATAFTVTQRKAQKIQQIQICPWFMNYVASVQYQVVRTNTLKGWIYRALNLRPTWLGGRTAMDALALFDHTVLHEVDRFLMISFDAFWSTNVLEPAYTHKGRRKHDRRWWRCGVR